MEVKLNSDDESQNKNVIVLRPDYEFLMWPIPSEPEPENQLTSFELFELHYHNAFEQGVNLSELNQAEVHKAWDSADKEIHFEYKKLAYGNLEYTDDMKHKILISQLHFIPPQNDNDICLDNLLHQNRLRKTTNLQILRYFVSKEANKHGYKLLYLRLAEKGANPLERRKPLPFKPFKLDVNRRIAQIYYNKQVLVTDTVLLIVMVIEAYAEYRFFLKF
ncbi:hypothetical protein RhiirA1_387255 [Rhizophagus irregularis]|uniref:Uncharacterized protein n=1 Tax=Rhizophagus irregularis TaxID=588596 RepID=A0A2N0SIY7_9GLOM|nr:hypothetical protein RhiirA1_387255 [Rhizophagus irregularis]CAB4486444.1 unnamed protein product [Rhizophagus irregularis]